MRERERERERERDSGERERKKEREREIKGDCMKDNIEGGRDRKAKINDK